MKRLFLLVAMLGLVCGSCDKNNDEAPNNGGVYDQTLTEATLAIDQLIAEGKDFVAEEVEWNSIWYIDALFEYNGDFSKVTKICSALGGEPWSETYEPVVEIYNDKVTRIVMAQDYALVKPQSGVFEYYSRTKTIYVDMQAVEGYAAVAIEAKVMAVTSDYVVLEWTANEMNYRGVFKSLSYEAFHKLESISAELQVERAIAEMGEFDKSKVEELILGTWVGETWLECEDDTYQRVSRVGALFGMPYLVPQAPLCDKYTFSAESVEVIRNSYVEPDSEPVTYNFDWSYEAETANLTISFNDGIASGALVAINDKAMYWQFEHREGYYILGFRRVN